jgi:molybdopterin converting factor small subunit
MPGGRPETEVDVSPGDLVSAVLARIGVPAGAAALILVNDRVASPATALSPGDSVILFPLVVGG